jgi:hypothetical protein
LSGAACLTFLTFTVILGVMATPVRVAVADDNFKKDRGEIRGAGLTPCPADTALLPEEVFIFILAIYFLPSAVKPF